MIADPRRRAALRFALSGAAALGLLAAAASAATPATTPASGPSWLSKLGRDFDKSSLGRVGALGPNEQDPELQAAPPRGGAWLRDGFEVRGADLFRFTCRSCHGVGGRGLPPEILPLTERVQATSAELQRKRESSAAGDRAAVAEQLLRHRIESGGPSMPGFDFLSTEEEDVLIAYLERLAGVPDPRHADRTIRVPVDRVGELIVKGTCQTCHDSSRMPGAKPAPWPIPTLESLPASHTARGFVAAARHRGQGGLHGRGPEVSYLRDQELEAAYFFLAAYPAQ